MKIKSKLFLVIAGIVFIVSCKKEETPMLDPSTPFVLNGTTYTPKGMSYVDFGGGYMDVEDTAFSSDGNRILIIDMAFNLTTSKPTTGSYAIFTDSTSLVSANHVQFYFYEMTRSNKILNSYDILPPGTGTLDVTNLSDRISLKFGSQSLRGITYDTNTSVSNGVYFYTNLSAATLTEQ
jgi:hypothetical protein